MTVYLERFLASVDLPGDKNILDIREYSREYRPPLALLAANMVLDVHLYVLGVARRCVNV